MRVSPLTNNNMEIICVDLLTWLQFLCSCRFNSISRIHDSSLVGLKKVELLMLHSNDLHHLPDTVFRDMKSLQVNKVKQQQHALNPSMLHIGMHMKDFVYNQIQGWFLGRKGKNDSKTTFWCSWDDPYRALCYFLFNCSLRKYSRPFSQQLTTTNNEILCQNKTINAGL